jgi:hypothetical protein
MRWRALFALACLVLAGAGAGCGTYGFSSSLLPAHIRSVAVPLPENRTNRSDLAAALADSLTEAFLNDQTLKVVGEREADSVVEGIVLEYRREPFTFDAQENVQTYRVEIVMDARFVDVRKNQVIWERKRLSQWDTQFRLRGRAGAGDGRDRDRSRAREADRRHREPDPAGVVTRKERACAGRGTKASRG